LGGRHGSSLSAFDKHLGREVAIKTITEGFAGDPEMLERFYREAAKTGMLKHPNIVTVYDLANKKLSLHCDGVRSRRSFGSGDPICPSASSGFRLRIIEAGMLRAGLCPSQ